MKEKTLEASQVYKYGLLIIFPIIILLSVLFVLLWGHGFREIKDYYVQLKSQALYIKILMGGIIPFLIFNLGIVLHEAIHAFLFAMYAKNGFRSVKLGFKKKDIVPYAHCKEKLKLSHYRISLIAPTVLLGIFPMLIALFTGNAILWFYAYIFLIAGIGDILLFSITIGLSSKLIVADHPQKLGFTYELSE
jgi:hypothetical protein